MPRQIVLLNDGARAAYDLEDQRFASFDSLRLSPIMSAIAAGGPIGARDAGEAMAFAISQLAYTEQQAFERKYTPLQYEELVPLSFAAGEWATSIRYEISDYVGQGRRSSGRGRDVPMVDVMFADQSMPVVNGSIGYGYTQEELRQTTHLRRALPDRRLQAAIMGYRRHMNTVALTGEFNLTGLFNNANVPQGNAVTSNWISATADLVLADLNAGLLAVWTNTAYNNHVNTIILPPSIMASLTSRRASTNGSESITILEFLKKNNIAKTQRGIDITFAVGIGLETAGTGSTKRVVYYDKSEENVVMHLPMPLSFLAPQFQGLDVEIPGEYKYAGVLWHYPKTAYYQDGV